MEERKIQRVGKNTLTVSLPYWWARKHKLTQGNVLCIEENYDGSLILWPRKTERGTYFMGCSINADSCDRPGLLQRLIIGGYILGADLIEIFSKNRLNYKHIKETREVLRRLLGVSVIKENEKELILQCFLNTVNFPVHSLIRRMYTLAASMHEESIQALLKGNRDLAKMVITRDDEVDRMYYLLLRALSMAQRGRVFAEKLGIEGSSLEISCLRTIGYCIERMADWSELIAKSVLRVLACNTQLDQKFLQKLLKFNEACREVHQKAIDAFFSKNLDSANEAIWKYREELEIGEGKILEQARYKSSKCRLDTLCPHFTTIVWGLRRQAELGAEIAEIAIDMNMRLLPEIVQIGKVDEKKFMEITYDTP